MAGSTGFEVGEAAGVDGPAAEAATERVRNGITRTDIERIAPPC